ncbi:MAG: AgmX/PglI C-terminal domain-containing protein [Candidatus Zixiibacteriota bacterium]|jgi:TonB family protein
MRNKYITRCAALAITLLLVSVVAAEAQRRYDVDPIPYPITSPGKTGYAPGEWRGREKEAETLVKYYRPPNGEGSIADRINTLASLAKGTDYEVRTVVDWDAEQQYGPYYVVFYEIKTQNGWHDFLFMVDLSKPEIEPITRAARAIWYGNLPEALTEQANLVIRPVDEATAAMDKTPRTIADVEEVMAKYQEDIVKLYRDHLKVAPDIAGRVLTAFVVSADGSVVSSSVIDSTTDDDAFDAALGDLIKTFKFPSISAGQLEIVYPFVFSSGKDPKNVEIVPRRIGTN